MQSVPPTSHACSPDIFLGPPLPPKCSSPSDWLSREPPSNGYDVFAHVWSAGWRKEVVGSLDAWQPGAQGLQHAVCSPGCVASGPRPSSPVHVAAGDPGRLQDPCGPSQRWPWGPAPTSGLHWLHAPFPETLAPEIPEIPLQRSWAPGPRRARPSALQDLL